MAHTPDRRRRRAALTAIACVLMLAAGAGTVWAAFTEKAQNGGNELRAAPDWAPPRIGASIIQKTQGGATGYVRPGGTYRVYAAVEDVGNPPSAVASVTTPYIFGPVTLNSETTTLDGTSFNYRTPTLYAFTSTNGTYTYPVTATDFAGNTVTQGGFTYVVDGTAPTATAVAAANKAGGIAGRPEIGDTVTFTYSEPIDPESILAGWNGSATSVGVRIENNVSSRDVLSVLNPAGTATLPLGSVNLGRNDFVTANTNFGTSGTRSTMTLNGNSITVVLGTASGSPTTASGNGSLIWTPSATATDRAGNAVSTTTLTESGNADRDF